MIACTNARRFPGVRCCTSSTMATLPLYLIACPLRRSFAAAINRWVVEEDGSSTTDRALEQLELRQVLRVDDSDRHALFVHDDEIVDLVALEEGQYFHGDLVLLHGDGIQRHKVGHEPFADPRIVLEMPRKIAVRENPE